MNPPTRPCPLCSHAGGAEAFPYETSWDGTTFRFVRCDGCGATFVDPAPTDEQLGRIYSWDAYHGREYADADPGPYAPSVRSLAVDRPPPARLLDFGCGGGGFLRAAAAAGYEVEGSEYAPDVAARVAATTGVPVRPLDALLADGARFDVVVLRDVLPHLVDPVATLRQLERLLAPGGAYYLDSPLEEQASLVRLVAQAGKRLRRRLGLDRPSAFAPTMLFRVDAGAQRRFLAERMGYRERSFAIEETGWPYRVPGRRPRQPGLVVKQAIGELAVVVAAAARRLGLPLGNRFHGVYEP